MECILFNVRPKRYGILFLPAAKWFWEKTGFWPIEWCITGKIAPVKKIIIGAAYASTTKKQFLFKIM